MVQPSPAKARVARPSLGFPLLGLPGAAGIRLYVALMEFFDAEAWAKASHSVQTPGSTPDAWVLVAMEAQRNRQLSKR